jgi:hypothetical protein
MGSINNLNKAMINKILYDSKYTEGEGKGPLNASKHLRSA